MNVTIKNKYDIVLYGLCVALYEKDIYTNNTTYTERESFENRFDLLALTNIKCHFRASDVARLNMNGLSIFSSSHFGSGLKFEIALEASVEPK